MCDFVPRGFGGGRVLTAEYQKQILKQENEGEQSAKLSLIEVARKMLEEVEDTKAKKND